MRETALSQTLLMIIAIAFSLPSATCVFADTGNSAEASLTSLTLVDIQGNSHQPFKNEKTKACVLIFVSTDCPIANAFQPDLRSLHQTYGHQGVACYMIYCAPRLTAATVTKHVDQYEVQMPAIFADSQGIAKRVGATVTPEAIIVNRSGTISYRGMINKLYAVFGKKRQLATKHYLRDACDEILENRTVTTTSTKPIGGFIH